MKAKKKKKKKVKKINNEFMENGDQEL